jgi:predicted AAA+ superfamily ATPase
VDDFPRKWLFVLTGSSARKLKKQGVNLLPGRIFSYRLFPLLYWELGKLFSLERTLRYGGLPEIYLQEYGSELIQEYAHIYLREEIQAEAVVRKIDSFARFLDVAAERSGQIVNFSSIASDTEIPKETIRRYYSILEETLLIERIPGYADVDSSRKAIQKEKIIFFDVGVRNAILGRTENAMSSEELGNLFEQWLIVQIIALFSYHKRICKFFFYRDEQKNEVDLIIEENERLTAIEIKYSTKAKTEHFKGLRTFSRIARKPVDSYLVFRGETQENWDNIMAVPYGAFLDMMKAKLADKPDHPV